jgi:tRNA G10  N-methylase Trm11
MEVSKILLAAILKARRTVVSGVREQFIVNFDDAIRNFKRSWIYTSPTSLKLDTREAAGSYLFVFSKNLHVTNITLPELLSLTRTYTTRRSDQSKLKLNFFSNEEYTRYLTNNLAALFPVAPIFSEAEFERIAGDVASLLAEQHAPVICDTVILDAYFTTALMHIPLTLATNVQNIVFESGYVHSAGHSLYIRRVEKAKQSELEEGIQLFLRNSGAAPPIFVTPYADEYFAPWEKQNSATSIRNGLDGIRIELRKHFLQGQPLRDYLNSLHERVPDLRVAPGLKHYNTEREESKTNPDWTIWLISDTRHVTTEDKMITRGRDHYLMVYAQKYHNANQFVLFKERKLAWTAPITLPHTLSTSMVNIARSGITRREDRKPVIVDPFCGTGTTLIDAALRVPDAIVLGMDKNRLMPRLIEDNLAFFSKERADIGLLEQQYETLSRRIETVLKGTPNVNVHPINQVLSDSKHFKLSALAGAEAQSGSEFEIVLQACLAELRTAAHSQATLLVHGSEKIIDDGFSGEMTALLAGSGISWNKRTLFFATWRGIVNGRQSVRADTDLYQVLQREYETIAKELNDYLQSLAQPEVATVGNFSGRRGTYSIASIVNPTMVAQIKHEPLAALPENVQSLATERIHTLVAHDSTAALEQLEDQVDLVITDPPYGFNTHEFETAELQKLYGRFVRSAVKSLRSGGQLVLVVPAFARNGKQVPYFLTEGALIRQIVGGANTAGRDVLNVIHTVPAKKSMYLPPFYWNSPSALSRKILWFTLG